VEKDFDLMDDPASIGAAIQILLLMNPNKAFTLRRRGETVVITDED
jgi:hypothetical protein